MASDEAGAAGHQCPGQGPQASTARGACRPGRSRSCAANPRPPRLPRFGRAAAGQLARSPLSPRVSHPRHGAAPRHARAGRCARTSRRAPGSSPSTSAGADSRAGTSRGQGLEIGALHRPLWVPSKGVVVRYVDRMDVALPALPLRRARRRAARAGPHRRRRREAHLTAGRLRGLRHRQPLHRAHRGPDRGAREPPARAAPWRHPLPRGAGSPPHLRLALATGDFVAVARDHREGPAWSRRSHQEEWAPVGRRVPAEQVAERVRARSTSTTTRSTSTSGLQGEFLELFEFARDEGAHLPFRDRAADAERSTSSSRSCAGSRARRPRGRPPPSREGADREWREQADLDMPRYRRSRCRAAPLSASDWRGTMLP